jgi:hypothetical protein
MLRDPFYRQIDQALEGPLDPQLFERCMGDLLRKDYPWIVPVSGGTDSGMDGAIADGEGEPFPLVCTTEEDVIGNLTRSLDSYLKKGLRRRKVVLATSRRLTTRRRENLFKRAREKDFELLQVFEREGIADRLVGSPRWSKELLDLAWKPSALSTLPRKSRPLIEIEPVGRESDLAWIVETSGDRVLSGEPGSGKTFLFHHLMRRRDWPGLFLADTDLREIRSAWLDQRPRIIVVDDAHVEPDLLSRLVRLRQEMEASFEIVAVTWNGGCEEVIEALGVPATRVHRLELLTRNEILGVIQNVGVEASEEVLRDLVSQSANKPGLAVTIASLWKQGSYQEVLEGTALTRTLTTFFRRFLGPESTDVLACLALGGDRGMQLEAVGNVLQVSRPTLREIASGLASGGVLSQIDRETLAVWPRKLRYSLIRSVFFSGTPGVHDYRRLLDLAPSRQAAVDTLVTARHHGADIPSDELRDLVAHSGSRDAWRGLVALSKEDALWALQHYPGDVVDIAGAALTLAGQETILRVLQRAETASGPAHSQPLHPMRILQDWAREPNIPQDEIVPRRKLLAGISQKYLRAGGGRSVGLQGICLAFFPSLEGTSSDPGAGLTVTQNWGPLLLEELREVTSIWPEVRGNLDGIEAEDWQHLSSFLWNWIHPTYATKGEPVSEETERLMREFAAEVLRDLAPFVRGKPGLSAKVRELAQSIGLDLNLEPDPVYDRLFPSTAHWLQDWKQHEKEWESSLEALARQWVSRDPAEIAELLAGYMIEAQRIGQNSGGGPLEVCRRIAMQVDAPEVWLDALLAYDASGFLTGPFIKRIVEAQQEGWENQAERFLGFERHLACFAAEAVVCLPSPPAYLLSMALERLTELPQILERLCMRREIPIESLKALFRDPRKGVALTAVVGEWNADREGGVRPELAADWRFAILNASVYDSSTEDLGSSLRSWLGLILSKDANLAFEWLVERLRDAECPYSTYKNSLHAMALSALERGKRLCLVEELEKGRVPKGFVRNLVGKDLDVFKRVLSSEDLREQHLEPLGYLPDGAWMDLALVALRAGHGLNEVIGASLKPRGDISPKSLWGLENWQEYEHAFAQLATDPRDQVREVARRGQQLAAEEGQEAEKNKRQFAIHGRYV